MKTLEQLMELADDYYATCCGTSQPTPARAALLAALVKVTEALDIQAGSIEAVQSANQRLAAENNRLRDALETINGTTDGTDCNEVARAALKETK